MSGGVLITDGPIIRRGDDRSVPYYNRADRNFVAQRRVAGEIESVPNVLLVGSESACNAKRGRTCAFICPKRGLFSCRTSARPGVALNDDVIAFAELALENRKRQRILQ